MQKFSNENEIDSHESEYAGETFATEEKGIFELDYFLQWESKIRIHTWFGRVFSVVKNKYISCRGLCRNYTRILWHIPSSTTNNKDMFEKEEE